MNSEANGYMFRDFYIRPDMLAAIRRYIDDRIPPGDFLTAVICNDLREATGRADDGNLLNLPAFVAYFYNEAPAACWGNAQKMEAWLERDDGSGELHDQAAEARRRLTRARYLP
jgi:hypothetical protein